MHDSKDTYSRIAAHEESQIDAAVSEYLASGKDALLHLEFAEGSSEMIIRASLIRSWFRSTPTMRERTRDLDAKVKAENDDARWSDDHG